MGVIVSDVRGAISVKIDLPPRKSHAHPKSSDTTPIKNKVGLKRTDYIGAFFKNINWKAVEWKIK